MADRFPQALPQAQQGFVQAFDHFRGSASPEMLMFNT
jgi:hypothetical protein